MVFDLILENVNEIFSVSVDWVLTANEILSWILTLLYYLMFALLPLILFIWFVGFFSPVEERNEKKHKRYYRN